MTLTSLTPSTVSLLSRPAQLHLPARVSALTGRTWRPAVAVDPNNKLPGTAQLTSLIGGLMTWVLLACVLTVLAGAAAWGFGARGGHLGATQQGRLMVLGGAVGAMVTGAATALVNFAFGIGGTVH
jgi:hypothetical protein